MLEYSCTRTLRYVFMLLYVSLSIGVRGIPSTFGWKRGSPHIATVLCYVYMYIKSVSLSVSLSIIVRGVPSTFGWKRDPRTVQQSYVFVSQI